MQAQSLGQEDLLGLEIAPNPSILPWKIQWSDEPGGLYSPWDCNEFDITSRINSCLSSLLINVQESKIIYLDVLRTLENFILCFNAQ